MMEGANVKFRVPVSYTLPEPVQWGRVFLSEPVMPDNSKQTSNEETSYFLLLCLSIYSIALSSPVSWAQLFVFSPPAVNMVPLGHIPLLPPLEGSCSDLSCFGWCLTPANFWVWLVTPSFVLTAGREPHLFHKKKFVPGRSYEEDLSSS